MKLISLIRKNRNHPNNVHAATDSRRCQGNTRSLRRAVQTALIERLEGRQLMSATLVVNTTLDQTDAVGSGIVSLRDAIAVANSSSSPTTITFDPAVFATPQTITLNGKGMELSNTSASTTITGPAAGVTVDGNHQSGGFQIDANVTATVSYIAITNDGNRGITNFGTLMLANVTVSGNRDSVGGGILNVGTVTLNDVTVSGNVADNGGGGIYNVGIATLTNVTVSGNFAATLPSASGGGGIFNAGVATLTNVTVAGNTSNYGFGGGIDVVAGAATLTNVTVSGNKNLLGGFLGFPGGGGGIANENPTTNFTIANSIIAGNMAPIGPDALCPVTSLGFNLVGNTSGTSGFSTLGDRTGTGSSPLNARLGLLANNGGPTLTMLPLPGSPAIDGGETALIPAGIATDQRGLPRVSNGFVDIGAVEAQFTIQVNPPASQSTTEGSMVAINLGSFAVSGPTAPFVVDVNWGDGSTDNFFTLASPGNIPLAFHTFAKAGKFTTTVTVSDNSGPVLISNSSGFTVTVADAPLSGSPAPTKTIVGTTLSATLATFTDADPGAALSDYTATIAWGDGSSSTGTVSFMFGTTFAVSGSHTYEAVGFHVLTVAIEDSGGSSLSLSPYFTMQAVPSIALIAPAAQSVPPGQSSLVALGSFTQVNATGPFMVDVNWGDGTPDSTFAAAPGTIPPTRHQFVSAGNRNVTLSVSDAVNHVSNTAVFAVAVAPPVPQTLVVNTTLDQGDPVGSGIVSLRDAIAAANASTRPTIITFDPTVFATSRTITLAENVMELNNMFELTTIIGPKAGVTLDGNKQAGGFQIDANVTANISNFTLTDNRYGGISNFGIVTLSNVAVSGNTGGGIKNHALATLTLNNGTVSGNTPNYLVGVDGKYALAPDFGGGIENAGIAILTNVTVSGNTTGANMNYLSTGADLSEGGAGINNTGTLTLTNVNISGNFANHADGGGIYNAGAASLTNVTITGNSAAHFIKLGSVDGGHGGGIYNAPGVGAALPATLNMNNVTVSGNTGSFSGGGIDNAGAANLTNVTVANNQTGVGVIIGINYIDAVGGGIENAGTVTLTNVSISGNYSVRGGGVSNETSGSAFLTNVTLWGNSTGGGIYNLGASTLTHTTVYDNSGLGIWNSGTLTLSGDTISANTGGIYTSASFTIANSIISGNGQDVGSGFINSLGFNLIGDAGGSTGWKTSDLIGTAVAPLNARLGALANNGGPTLTLMPLAGSPAIDHGSNALLPKGITTDQAGHPRIVNGTIDIGAVEVQAAATTTIVATAAAAQTAIAGVAKLFALGSFAQTGANGPYSIDVNWGDGSADTKFSQASAGTITAQTHTFTKAGTGTLNVTITDAKGNKSHAARFSATVSPAGAAKLVIVQQPTAGTAGAALGAGFTVDVEDTFGNIVITDSSNVSLAISTGPTGGILTGMPIVKANKGVAVFGALALSKAGTFTIRATDGKLTAVVSKSVVVK